MEESLFRKNSVEHISSPEQLNDYLRVTSPAIWVVLIAVIILLAGVLIWASFANIDSGRQTGIICPFAWSPRSVTLQPEPLAEVTQRAVCCFDRAERVRTGGRIRWRGTFDHLRHWGHLHHTF